METQARTPDQRAILPEFEAFKSLILNEPNEAESVFNKFYYLFLEQQAKITNMQKIFAQMEEQKRLEYARRYGPSSEIKAIQRDLFDEAEVECDQTDDEPLSDEASDDDAIEVAAHTKRRPKRKPLPADLPRHDIHHDLDDADKLCGCCGDEMTKIGETVTEKLDIVPAQIFVEAHHCPTYSCSKCDESIKTTPLPPQPIPKGNAGPGLLAYVATAKYSDALPLYRQSKQFERLGIELPRNTLASHMIRMGDLVEPLILGIRDHIRGYGVTQMDETQVQVLKEPNKTAQSKSYMWVMKGGPPDKPAVMYHYDPTRKQEVPDKLLGDYSGYLQIDGYSGYNGILKSPKITGVGCWAHVRRKFVDAKKALPEQSKDTKLHQALAYIGKLYGIERAGAKLTADERTEHRQEKARPVLEDFHAWLNKQSIPPKSVLGAAIKYTLSQWPRLIVYVEDGRLNIDNNLVENAIRPFVVGRKNWLFSDTQNGAHASANLYSLMETAKAQGLNEYGYFKYIFTELPKATSEKDIQALLPWNVDPAVIRRQFNTPWE